jgi:hypothetical protein
MYKIGDKLNKLTIIEKPFIKKLPGRSYSHYFAKFQCECGNSMKHILNKEIFMKQIIKIADFQKGGGYQ